MTYIQIVWKKEKIHWIRMKNLMTKEFKGFAKVFGLIIVLFLSLIHYAFAGWHSLYELVLFIFARKVFKLNLARLQMTIPNIEIAE